MFLCENRRLCHSWGHDSFSRECQWVTPLHVRLTFFYVLLTMHPGTILGKWATWWKITLHKTFIIIILYMFRATLCSSSGGRIILIQHLVHIVLSVSDRPVCTCTPDGHLRRILYQMLHYYNSTSWWWAQCCSKHVQDYNNKRFI